MIDLKKYESELPDYLWMNDYEVGDEKHEEYIKQMAREYAEWEKEKEKAEQKEKEEQEKQQKDNK